MGSEDSTRLLLWVFSANNKRSGEITHTYARTEIDARAAMGHWMAEQAAQGRDNIEVKHWPGGFVAGYRAYWAGSIPAQPQASEVSDE